MQKRQRKFVDIKEWELPALADREENLVRELASKRLAVYLDEDTLGRQLHTLIFDRVRKLAQTAVNEAITSWLQGLGNGNNAKFPELCIEFPYWQQTNENIAPLTITYSVDNQDGTRTEINRMSLGSALLQLIENKSNLHAHSARCVSVMATELRDLAARIEAAAKQAPPHTMS
jgi:hypothetical protein